MARSTRTTAEVHPGYATASNLPEGAAVQIRTRKVTEPATLGAGPKPAPANKQGLESIARHEERVARRSRSAAALADSPMRLVTSESAGLRDIGEASFGQRTLVEALPAPPLPADALVVRLAQIQE